MQSSRKTILLLVSLIPICMLLSCSTALKPPQVTVHPDPAEKQQSASVAKRFQESAPQSPTVVESAMELSKKHAKLSEEAALLRQQNRELTTKNQQLKDRIVTLEGQLEQTEGELNEANDLLIDMRIELNNWKRDILGFRDEMRDAETAQLEALLKILKVLGGEVEAESARGQDTSSAVASVSKPGQPQQ